MKSLHELRQEGYKAYVKHHRVFDIMGVKIGAPIVENNEVVDVDNVLTRGEFEGCAEQYLIYLNNKGNIENLGNPSYGACVAPRGGFTEVELISPNGETLRGKYNFNNKPFCRKKGLVAALGRALKT